MARKRKDEEEFPEENIESQGETEIPPEKVNLQKSGGSVVIRPGETVEGYTIKLTSKDVIRYIVGSSISTVEDALRVGYSILKEYYFISKQNGYNDVYDFIKDAVNFFIEFKDKVPALMEENKKLKAYITLVNPIVMNQIADIKYMESLQTIYVYALLTNADIKTIEYMTDKLKKEYDEFRRKTVEISFGDFESSLREVERTTKENQGENRGKEEGGKGSNSNSSNNDERR